MRRRMRGEGGEREGRGGGEGGGETERRISFVDLCDSVVKTVSGGRGRGRNKGDSTICLMGL